MLAILMLAAGGPASADNAASGAPSCPYRPTHAVPLSVSADDYPLLSLANSEEGRVVVQFVIRPDGSISDVGVARSSGFARLDGATVDIARQRWHFDPVLVDGNPISCRYQVEVAWSLETSPEELEEHGFAVVRLGAADYPPEALARREAGLTLVIAIVDKQGKITKAYKGRSSGFSDLDASAVQLVESGKWPVVPAQIDGKPVGEMVRFAVVWTLSGH